MVISPENIEESLLDKIRPEDSLSALFVVLVVVVLLIPEDKIGKKLKSWVVKGLFILAGMSMIFSMVSLYFIR